MADKKSELQDAIDALDSGKFDSSAWNVIKKVLSNNGDESWSADEQQSLLDKFRDYAYHTPEGRRELQAKLRETSSQRYTKQYKPFFNAILNGADIATSLGQINTSNNALKALAQPSIAGSPGEATATKNQLAAAQQGGLEAARAIAPAKQQIQQSQQIADTNAAITSGGNQANYQANVQANALGAERAATQLPAIQDTIKNRYQARADQLATHLDQLKQQDYGNRLYGSQLALAQYIQQAQAAGALGQAGRLNLRNTLQQIPDNVAGIVGHVASLPKSQPHGYPIVNSSAPAGPPTRSQFDASQYGPLFEDYANKVHSGLQKTFTDLYSSQPVSYIP